MTKSLIQIVVEMKVILVFLSKSLTPPTVSASHCSGATRTWELWSRFGSQSLSTSAIFVVQPPGSAECFLTRAVCFCFCSDWHTEPPTTCLAPSSTSPLKLSWRFTTRSCSTCSCLTLTSHATMIPWQMKSWSHFCCVSGTTSNLQSGIPIFFDIQFELFTMTWLFSFV